MKLIDIAVDRVRVPDWNANSMDEQMRSRLTKSIERFGCLVPIVVREISGGEFETVGGAQRLAALKDLGFGSVPCVVVEADDSEAMLLAQSLNRLHGEDDPALRAGSLRRILQTLSTSEVLAVLPETSDSLADLTSLGTEDLATHLQAWQAAQAARLKHLTVQLSQAQLEVVEEALEIAMAGVTKDPSNPNRRGNALFALCSEFIRLSSGGRL